MTAPQERPVAGDGLDRDAVQEEAARQRRQIRRVLEAHRSGDDGRCAEDGFSWPCATVRDLAGWGGEA